MQVLGKQSFTIRDTVNSIKPRSTLLDSHSSSPKGRLPATLSPIVMRPPEDVATLAQR